MPRITLPLEIVYLIIEQAVVSCLDEAFMRMLRITSPILEVEATIQSLLETSIDIRRATVRVMADGLSIGVSKAGVWSLRANPWLIIRCNPRVLTSGILAQSYDSLGHNSSTARAPVRAFYTLYHTAANDLTCAEDRRRSVTEVVQEDCEPRAVDRPADLVQRVLQAQKRLELALQMARCAPAIFRAQLLWRAEDLRVRVHRALQMKDSIAIDS